MQKRMHKGKIAKQSLANRLFAEGQSNAEVLASLNAMHSATTMTHVKKMRHVFKEQTQEQAYKILGLNPDVQKVVSKTLSDEDVQNSLMELIYKAASELKDASLDDQQKIERFKAVTPIIVLGVRK